jgi:phospholipase/carboxylesterase
MAFSTDNALIDVKPFAARPTVRDPSEPAATFAPIHYEPGYAYPLLVWLHSTAGNEHELRQVMPLVSMRNYVAVAPRGPSPHPRYASQYGWRQSQDEIELAEAGVAECVAATERRFNIHPNRIFLVGCGAGGTMALRIAWNDPNRYAGVVSIGGPLPKRWRPLHRVNAVRRVPCLLVTSRDSGDYPASQVCTDLRLLHSAGCTVALRQYPGRDELTNNMLSDLNRWLMHLVCGGTHDC